MSPGTTPGTDGCIPVDPDPDAEEGHFLDSRDGLKFLSTFRPKRVSAYAPRCRNLREYFDLFASSLAAGSPIAESPLRQGKYRGDCLKAMRIFVRCYQPYCRLEKRITDSGGYEWFLVPSIPVEEVPA
jgi:hypothetical protein